MALTLVSNSVDRTNAPVLCATGRRHAQRFSALCIRAIVYDCDDDD